MTIGSPIPSVAASAIAAQHGHREHIHREVMLPAEPDFHTSHGETFWPTCREYQRPTLPPINVRCQRCGRRIRPASGWWCRRCSKIAAHLQCQHGLSMVQIAASGEWEPLVCPIADDLIPWAGYNRVSLPTMTDSKDTQLFHKRRYRTDRKQFHRYSVVSRRGRNV